MSKTTNLALSNLNEVNHNMIWDFAIQQAQTIDDRKVVVDQLPFSFPRASLLFYFEEMGNIIFQFIKIPLHEGIFVRAFYNEKYIPFTHLKNIDELLEFLLNYDDYSQVIRFDDATRNQANEYRSFFNNQLEKITKAAVTAVAIMGAIYGVLQSTIVIIIYSLFILMGIFAALLIFNELFNIPLGLSAIIIDLAFCGGLIQYHRNNHAQSGINKK